MGGARQTGDTAKAQATDALKGARLKTRQPPRSPNVGPQALMALQRSAGNAAVNALMAGRLRFPGKQAVADIDAALREIRRDEPVVDTVEKGLKAAKAAGVPVDLEGVRPPPSALAVTATGFGPGSVPAKKQVPPPKKVPAVSPLGRAAAKKAAPAIKAKGGAKPAPAGPAGGAAAAVQAPAPLTADQLLQPPVPPSHARPEDDPSFTQVTAKVKATGRAKRAHPPAASKAKEAQDAALPPAGDIGSQAKAAKADTMEAQQPGTFDKKAFITAVKAAIEAKSPKTLKEADDYKSSGKAGEVKGEVKGLVTEGKQGQAKDMEAATAAAPDQSKAVPKPVTPMGPEQEAPAAPIPATGAVPKPAPPEQLNLEAGKQQANQEMAEAEVSEPQLAQSNEPEFQQALDDKKAAAAHADTAPGEFRKQESEVIQQGKADATEETAKGINGMQSAKGAALAKLVADKGKAKTKDEAKRAEVTTKIEGIFNAAEADVKKILEGIDPKVEKEFNAGEADARAIFENYVAAKMSAYKKDRYGGWLGGLRWAKDKLFGMPDKVNEFYVAGRELYLKEMDKVISRVADIVGNDLTAAKTRIAAGRNEIAAYVKSLPRDLKKVGSEASKEIVERFSQLESEVDSKQESLVDTLASKYVEARKGLDDRIEELQAENKGLVDKAIGAIKAVINTIRELVAMLKNVLARAAGAVGEIIKNPVGFLGNLIAGVKGGILKFKDNILDHLRKGLMSWLFGALAEAGIELPDTFDLKGIIKLLASIFGLTWTNIRNRIVKQIGEKAMAAVEKGVEIFQVIATQGISGLWQMLLEKLGNIKEMILEQVKNFVITKIITAGITWLISLLNPAAAFIKACKLIYDVVMFFVNNGERIKKFVDTVLDSVSDIVRGNIGGVVNKINDVLGQMVPIIIGFLASLIGLSGIGAKIKEIIEKLQKPVNQAIDFVIKTGLKLAGPIIRGISGIAGKVKAKVAAGKAWVKGKVEAGKAWAKGKIEAAKSKLVGDGRGGERPSGPIRESFSMAGRSHTLTAVMRGNRLSVVMSSGDTGGLMAKAQAARTAQRDAGNTAAAEALDGFINKFDFGIRRIAGLRTDVAVAERQLLLDMAADLVRIGTQFGLKDLGSYEAIGQSDIALNRIVYRALIVAYRLQRAQRSRTGRAEPTNGTGPAELQQRFERLMYQLTADYERACRARAGRGQDPETFRGNVFTVGGSDYFVDHDANYIVPDSQVRGRALLDGKAYISSRPVLTDTNQLTGDPARNVIAQYRYSRAVVPTVGGMAVRTRSLAMGSLSNVSEHEVAVLLAALIAEARRNPIAHVTNQLLLAEGLTGGPSSGTHFHEIAPMTGGKTSSEHAPRDPTLSTLPNLSDQPPTEVTDAEVALVRQRFEARHGPLGEALTTLGSEDGLRRELVQFIVESSRLAGAPSVT